MANSFPRFVRDVMTRHVAVLHEEDNLRLAESGMEAYRFRHLPVVDGDKVVGLVSERDLLRASVSSLDSEHDLRDHNLKQYFFVREIMTLDVVTVHPDTLLLDAARLLEEKKLGCLPVVEEDGKLVGIVTQSDLVRLAARVLHNLELKRNSGARAATGRVPAE